MSVREARHRPRREMGYPPYLLSSVNSTNTTFSDTLPPTLVSELSTFRGPGFESRFRYGISTRYTILSSECSFEVMSVFGVSASPLFVKVYCTKLKLPAIKEYFDLIPRLYLAGRQTQDGASDEEKEEFERPVVVDSKYLPKKCVIRGLNKKKQNLKAANKENVKKKSK
ncbi:hypothetical protein J6590_059068 [Homalodisca vitripennis]|nr:hypothetical protein J6590_059068 [Homalodisca vitripennis]